ncbi:unnamed protein product [Eruca vesicaria subsp. sativa]|uniref:GTD-binding domain-containing protein n=1 Tax=Eruca vesicaria subsp. sativa TaxID=29727 RepID=A0ABC8K5L9_ERUVS|nr:unnamed protein product [Eruca vesicaria subsp. sativa]
MISKLYAELDEEQNAASTAANEEMCMILRLQKEKAEIEMDLRQFKRFAEEKMEHDHQHELLALEYLLYKRKQSIQAHTCGTQAYKHRMMSYGFAEFDFDREKNILSRNTGMLDNHFEYELAPNI